MTVPNSAKKVSLFKLSVIIGDTIPVGTKLQIGETLHEVTQIGKKCHAEDGCEIARTVGKCIMPKEGIFTKVLKGGVVKAGDEITIL